MSDVDEHLGAAADRGDHPLSAPLQAGLVSQELFLTNFFPSMYHPLLRGPSLALALAAAQLCDGVLDHTIEIRDGEIRLAPGSADTATTAATAASVVVAAMHGDRGARCEVGDCIDILAGDACERVALPLIDLGVIRRVAPRRWRRNPLPFEVTSAGQIATASPRGRLRSAATAGREFSQHDVAVFALLRALDLDRIITTDTPRHAVEYLHDAVAQLARPAPGVERRSAGRYPPPTAAERTGRALQDIVASLGLLLHREATRR